MGATRRRWLGRTLLVVGAAALAAAPLTQAGAAPTKKTPPGDPPGNNGTVKIERDGPMSAGRNNEPHVDGCIFWLEFYGFDQGQTADITFTAQAPSTPKDTVLIADKSVLISDTPAGGGQDKDYVIAYNLSSAVQGLKAHPKQGYHIKLTSDSLQAPGGAKQKVFWVKCAPAAASTLRVVKSIQGNGAGPFNFELQCSHRPLDRTFTLNGGDYIDFTDIPAGTTCAVLENVDNPISIEERPPSGPAVDGVVTLGAGTPSNVFVTNILGEGEGTPAPPDAELRPPAGDGTAGTAGTTGGTGSASGPDTSVLGETATRPEQLAALPRTGGGPGPLTAAGLWSLVAGGLALAAGRRLRRRA